MKKSSPNISVFEHSKLVVGNTYDDVEFSNKHFDALQRYHTETNGLYYDLGFKTIKFKEYVGVIQVGNLTIEILPKADNLPASEEVTLEWKKRLIDMLRAVGLFDIQAPSSSSLQLKNNSILELYFELYLNEIEYLLHRGLSKKYRKCEGNLYALKGNLLFQKHIQHNLVHQERSFVRYTIYDNLYELHCILYKALRLLKRINQKSILQSRIGALLLHFPEMPDIKVSEKLFLKQSFTRKTTHYQRAIQIAKLLLLNYHPDISKGGHHVLALMFDMNLLWEQFVYTSLKKQLLHNKSNVTIKSQVPKNFWKPSYGYNVNMRPDIVISSKNRCIVLDTKWKNLNGLNPSIDDLRQLYVYHQFFSAIRVAIVYPGNFNILKGVYFNPAGNHDYKECSLIALEPKGSIGEWQERIFEKVNSWINEV